MHCFAFFFSFNKKLPPLFPFTTCETILKAEYMCTGLQRVQIQDMVNALHVVFVRTVCHHAFIAIILKRKKK